MSFSPWCWGGRTWARSRRQGGWKKWCGRSRSVTDGRTDGTSHPPAPPSYSSPLTRRTQTKIAHTEIHKGRLRALRAALGKSRSAPYVTSKTFCFSSMQRATKCLCRLLATHWMCLCLCGSWITKQQLLPPPFAPLQLIHAASSARKLFSQNMPLLLPQNFSFSALKSHCARLYWFGNFLCTKKKKKKKRHRLDLWE